jgi:hypothetical protein
MGVTNKDKSEGFRVQGFEFRVLDVGFGF